MTKTLAGQVREHGKFEYGELHLIRRETKINNGIMMACVLVARGKLSLAPIETGQEQRN